MQEVQNIMNKVAQKGTTSAQNVYKKFNKLQINCTKCDQERKGD